jgi:hypothetical protein
VTCSRISPDCLIVYYLIASRPHRQAKGCCWIPSGTQGLPWCFFSNGVVNGYGVSSSKQTATGVQGTLKIGMREQVLSIMSYISPIFDCFIRLIGMPYSCRDFPGVFFFHLLAPTAQSMAARFTAPTFRRFSLWRPMRRPIAFASALLIRQCSVSRYESVWYLTECCTLVWQICLASNGL